MPKKISFLSLMILIIAAIDNIRNLPTAALFGSSLIFFFALSALLFLLPTSLISAELSAAFPETSGICGWVNKAFGKRSAMTAIWFQWINTMVWYPTMLSFIAGTFAYLIDPELVQNKVYLVTFTCALFWLLTLSNLKGLYVSAWINNVCCVIGTILPLLLLIVLGGIWVLSGQPLHLSFSQGGWIPPLDNMGSWTSLIAIMASFLGMELSGVHVKDIINPQKNFPKAVFSACFFIFVTMLLGSLAIAAILPNQEINLIAGVMQLYAQVFSFFGMEALTPIVTLLIVIGSTGTMINWLISPAKGLLQAAELGFLPPFFAKQNRHGVPVRLLFAQATLVSLFCLLFLTESSVNGFYWFMTALSTELYMVMYVLMFMTAIYLHYREGVRLKTFKVPGGTFGIWITTLLGLVGCFLTIATSFFPPDHIDIGSPLSYFVLICLGNLITISPLLLFFLYEKKSRLRVFNGRLNQAF